MCEQLCGRPLMNGPEELASTRGLLCPPFYLPRQKVMPRCSCYFALDNSMCITTRTVRWRGLSYTRALWKTGMWRPQRCGGRRLSEQRLHRHLTPFAAAQRCDARKFRPSFSAVAPDLSRPFDRSPESRRRCHARVRHHGARGKCPIGIFGIPSTGSSASGECRASS